MNLQYHSIRMWLVLLLLSLGLLAAMQVEIAHKRLGLARQHTDVQREVQSLHTEIGRLTLEFATLIRPERLRRLAISELGMRPPTPMQVIHP